MSAVTINLGNTNNSGSTNSFWGYGGTASKIGGALTGLASAGSSAYSTYADVLDAKSYIDRAHSLMFRPLDINDSYDYLKRDYSSWTPLTYLTPKDLGYSTSKGVLNTISSAGAGASAGASFGGIGAAVGGVLGLGMGLAGLFAGKNKAEKETRKVNNAFRDVNDYNFRTFGLRYDNLRDLEELQLLSSAYTKRGMGYADGGLILSLNSKVLSPFGNRFDDGGLVLDYLHSNGSDWNNGFTLIGTGGSHELNPLGGVLTSVDSEGNPNLLEEGEVQYESKDNGTWAYSARREIPKDDAKALGLNWHKGMTFADGMIERQKIAGLMPYDPIELRGFDAFAMRLAGILEREKQKDLLRIDNEFYANLAADGGLLNANNMFAFGGLMKPNILVNAGKVDIKDLSDEDWEWLKENGVDIDTALEAKSKLDFIKKLNDPKTKEVALGYMNRLALSKLLELEVTVPKFTNLGRSAYYGKNQGTPDKRLINDVVHSPTVAGKHYYSMLYDDTPFNRAWIENKRSQAIEEYKKEHPEDKKLKNFVDPYEEAMFLPAPVDLTDMNQYRFYTEQIPADRDLTDAEKQLNFLANPRSALKFNPFFASRNYTQDEDGVWVDSDGNELDLDTYEGDFYNTLAKTGQWNNVIGKTANDYIVSLHPDIDLFGLVPLEPEKPAEMPGVGLSPLRYASIVDSAVQLGKDLFNDTNVVDYTNTNMLRNRLASLDTPAYLEMLDFISPLPFALDYYTNQYLSQAGSDRRYITNNVGGNRASAVQSLLTLDLNTLNKLGELGRAALEYNRQDYLKTRDYNRQSKQFDADSTLKYNQMRLDSAKLQWDNLFKTVTMDDAMLNQVSLNRSTNRDRFYSNLEGLGEDAHNRRMLQMLINSGYFGTTLDLAWRNYRLDYDDWQAGRKNKNNQPNITVISALGGEIRTKRRKKHLTY